MKLVIDNINKNHYKWLMEMSKTLQFDVLEVEFSDEEEDAEILAAMEMVKDEPAATEEEVVVFKNWLKEQI